MELSGIDGSGLFRPIFSDSPYGLGTRWNIDGLLTYDHDESNGKILRYSQLFRNGIFEGVDAFRFRQRKADEEQVIYAAWFEHCINNGLANPLEVMRRIGVSPPVAVLVTVLGVQNVHFRTGARFEHPYDGVWQQFDGDTLVMPDVVIESHEIDHGDGLRRILRPIVDAFWQAGGRPKSLYYNAEGTWTPQG